MTTAKIAVNEKETQFKAEVVLLEPEIPQNTGSIARTCAALGCPLHLIEPLGFSLEDKYLKRAGMDYWHLVDVKCYPDIDAFFRENNDGRCLFFSKKVKKLYHEADYSGRVFLFFGKESLGLPESFLKKYRENCFRIPMLPHARSLNISNAVSVVLYEAYRQNGFGPLGISD
jgi:tRNA (cytidine/uridine-2'-O-)-methyltransferase